jgi:hypothetical protein
MLGHLRPRWLLRLLLILCLFPSISVSAQSPEIVRVSGPIIDQFPRMTVYVAVIDDSGRYIPGLSASNFSVLEDEIPISQVSVLEEEVGTRQTFVINTSSDLKLRDALGRSRFDLIRQALLKWWRLPEASLLDRDDLTLISVEGTLSSHQSSAANLAAILDQFQPAFEDSITGYDLLLQALMFPADPASAPKLATHVIFFTSLLRGPRGLAVENIIARARETGTTIHPVLIGPPDVLEQPEIESLRELAEATGGRLILFNPDLGLTDLADRILAQRVQYQLTYPSLVATAGIHQIQVRVREDNQESISDAQSFEINVRPPEATFITPPDRIIRRTDDPNLALSSLPPTSQTLRVLLTFPDGYPRPITQSQLWVDGEVVAQNLMPPYDNFEWDLSGYVNTATHTLQVYVEDDLGVGGSSIFHSVDIIVEVPPRGLAALRPALGSLLAAFAVLVAGVVLAVGLINMGRQRAAPSSAANETSVRRSVPLKRAGLRERADRQVEAYLMMLDPEGSESRAIPLSGAEFIMGSDPSLTSDPIDDPSVAGIHARLTRQAAGNFLIRDQGSVAGTWINFELIPEEGQLLKHGDMIHVGRVAFRFQLPQPPSPPEILIFPDIVQEKRSTSNSET